LSGFYAKVGAGDRALNRFKDGNINVLVRVYAGPHSLGRLPVLGLTAVALVVPVLVIDALLNRIMG